MKKVAIIQPVIPHYRVNFFSLLNENSISKSIDIDFYCSEIDHLNVKSIPKEIFEYNALGSIKHFRGLVCWQLGISSIDFSNYDAIVINGNPRYVSNLLIYFLAKINRCKVIWWGHGWSSRRNKIRSSIRMKIMNFFDLILLYTDKERTEFIEYGFSERKIHALNNGLDIDLINKYRKKYNPLERKNILFIGRVTEKSNFKLLISACKNFDRDKFNKIDVIGADLDDSLLEVMKDNKVNVDEYFSFHGEMHDERNISDIINRCKVFIYPGEVGLSLIHAFSYGIPAIIHSSNINHMPEHAAFSNGINGISFIENDCDSLSNAFNSIVSNNELLSIKSENASKLISKTFNTKDMASRFVNMIESI